MDTGETYIKMCEKAEEIQQVMGKHRGHLKPPDDGIYYRADPYPVALIYDHRPECPICGNQPDTKFCSRDGGELSPFLSSHLQFGGPCEDSIKKDRIIWLPRQDQLQEMVLLPSEFHRVCDKLYSFTDWVKKYATYETSECSMEQLWLAFAMKEKYNKVWNGEEWSNGI